MYAFVSYPRWLSLPGALFHTRFVKGVSWFAIGAMRCRVYESLNSPKSFFLAMKFSSSFPSGRSRHIAQNQPESRPVRVKDKNKTFLKGRNRSVTSCDSSCNKSIIPVVSRLGPVSLYAACKAQACNAALISVYLLLLVM